MEHFEKKTTIIAYVFPRVRTAKDVVRQMFKKTPFRRPLEKEHSKQSQTLLKFAQQEQEIELEKVALIDI